MSHQALMIVAGVVSAVTVLAIVTNLIDALVGPWRRLASQWPGQPEATDADRGRDLIAITKRPHSLAPKRSLGCGVISLVLLGGGILVAAAAFLSPWLAMVLLVPLLFAMTALVLIGWRRSFRGLRGGLGAFRENVDWAADDAHLHLRVFSGSVNTHPRVSVPWAAIDEISPDAAAPDFVTFPIGERYAHAPRHVVERELAVREAMTAGHPASDADGG